MRKVLAGFTVVAFLAIGALAFAHGPGWGGGAMMDRGCAWDMMGPGYRGHMMGPGYGGHMMGPGYGGHMMEPGHGDHMMGGPGMADKKFLDETVDLRKELHTKKFDFFEAIRNPDTDETVIAALEKDITEIQEKIFEKTPRRGYGRSGGYACH